MARRGEARQGGRVCTAPSRIKPDGQCDYKGKVRRTAAVYGAGTKLDFIPRSRHSRRDNEFIVVKLSSRVRSLLIPAFLRTFLRPPSFLSLSLSPPPAPSLRSLFLPIPLLSVAIPFEKRHIFSRICRVSSLRRSCQTRDSTFKQTYAK